MLLVWEEGKRGERREGEGGGGRGERREKRGFDKYYFDIILYC